MSRLVIAVQYASRSRALPDEASVRRWARTALAAAARQRPVTLSELTIRYVDRPEARTLNGAFRGKDYPTNVLTFPLTSETADIAICAAVVRLEALAQKKALADHHAHMVVHGVLHAAGFDHETDAEAEAMEAIEVAALARLGVKNPYE